ncbi:MAG TPA: TonB-dependent receptor [Gammaproteobacteria bacterium]|jgi:iron complex outermembrane receptor protein
MEKNKRETAWLQRSLLAAAVLYAVHGLPARAENQDLADMSLQELADLPVTSVSKKPESLADAAASIYVITSDAIRRSGARSIPEALRLAPNLEVAQIGADGWAISARGSDAASADKLLVLIDGRIIYTPLFSGTFWDAQDVMLEDIDRIEVVSGPGGTLWGSNAVNGVINIITKKAGDSQGTLASAGGGQRGADGDARYGGELKDGGHYRVYAMSTNTYASPTTPEVAPSDGLNMLQAGFRSDWSGADRAFTLQGDAYGNNEDQSLPGGRERLSGMNLLSHWDDKLESGSDISLLAYYDRTKRYAPTDYGETLDIADVELQQTLPEIRSQNLIWGASYRYAMDDIQNLPGSTLAFFPAQDYQAWSSVFLQDEAVLTEALRLTLGARAERNPYTGTEVLPNGRLAWKLNDDDLLWGAVSRAVRSPSRLDENLYSPGQPPFLLAGNPGYQSETAKVYELGFRSQPAAQWSYSATVYHSDYDHLRSQSLESSSPLLITFGNDMTAVETGVEMWGTYQPLDDWRLSAGFSALREDREITGTALPGSFATEGDDPSNWWSLRSSWDLPDAVQLDLSVRHVSALSVGNVSALPDPASPAYTTGDVRVGWSWRQFEFSVLAQDLFGPEHQEFGPTSTGYGRGLYLRLTWRQ